MGTLQKSNPRYLFGDTRRFMTTPRVRYSKALAEEICQRLGEGETLASIVRDPGMPCRQAVSEWARTRPEFRAAYEQARQDQLDCWHDECVSIADASDGDYREVPGRNGELRRIFDHEHVMRSKLRIETRQWSMSRLSKRYSEKFEFEDTSDFGGPDIVINFINEEPEI